MCLSDRALAWQVEALGLIPVTARGTEIVSIVK